MMEPLASVLDAYRLRCPRVRLEIVAATKTVDLIDERIDVALRVRTAFDEDVSLAMRPLGVSRWILVANHAVAPAMEADANVSQLSSLPTLSANSLAGEDTWVPLGADGVEYSIRHKPRMTCPDLSMLREAAIAGLGVALLPDQLITRSNASRGAPPRPRRLWPWAAGGSDVHRHGPDLHQTT
jgi:DNA-binding transcriptional LysR family regulator